MSNAANAARLSSEGVSDDTEFKLAYLAKGMPASSSNALALSGALPSVAEGVRRLHAAGATAVLAHPGIMECPDMDLTWPPGRRQGLTPSNPTTHSHSQSCRLRFDVLAAGLAS